MAIYIDENTQVVVQGATGKQGSFHIRQMLNYGTKIVAGTSFGKQGAVVEGVPVYNNVFAAAEEHRVDAAVLFVPAAAAKDAVFEALDAGVKIVVCLSEHIPVHDTMQIMALAKSKGATVVGPNTFGIVSSGKCKIGIMPNQFFIPGNVGVVARSGTLCYEIVGNLTLAGMGTSTVVGLGGDRVVGLNFIDVIKKFEADQETKAIVMVGEIGGSAEEEAAEYIKTNIKKPVFAYLAGKSAPAGKRMGHAGAIIERGRGTFEGKIKALRSAGVQVAELPFEVPQLIRQSLD
ncbi:MAG: succinate--CoA ligase subunit alpha [Bacillota bacterium]